MSKLNAAQRQWLADLGAIVGAGDGAVRAAAATPKVIDADEAKTAPQPIEALEDRRAAFKRARAQWVAVKRRAEEDLEKVKDGARMSYLADAAQCPKIEAGCTAIDEILDNLDDELRQTLDQYAATPLRDQKKLQALGASAVEILDRYQNFVANNALMRAIDAREFADVTVHAPVVKALKALRSSLQ